MTQTLILYASTHGQTTKIAERIGDELRGTGHAVTLHRAGHGDAPEAAGFDLVLVGASIHAGHHQRAVVDWVTSNRALLEERPSAFFSVSMTAAEDTAEAHESTAKMIADFEQESGWTPRLTAALAGALQYREYDFFTRLLMRAIGRSRGQSTDARKDIEYTDWDGVARFASAAGELAGAEVATL